MKNQTKQTKVGRYVIETNSEGYFNATELARQVNEIENLTTPKREEIWLRNKKSNNKMIGDERPYFEVQQKTPGRGRPKTILWLNAKYILSFSEWLSMKLYADIMIWCVNKGMIDAIMPVKNNNNTNK